MKSTLLQHRISDQAERRPEATALVFKTTRVSYGEVEASSNQLAHALIDAGCQPGDRIGILMPKVPQAIISMLGVLKAGAIYVPMDPHSPAPRLARMQEAAECRFILAAGPVGALLHEVLITAQVQVPRIGWLDAHAPMLTEVPPAITLESLAAYPATAPQCTRKPGDVAHILFTSGSTGIPKGVMITHANVLRFVGWANGYFGTSDSDRISQHPPLHFDLSTFDVYGTLGMGAELHLVPNELNLLPHKLAQFMCDSRLTQWFSVPSVLNMMAKFDVVVPGDFPDLKRILWCGEAIPTPTLMYWMRRLPHVQFTNLYGPTEATIASSYHTMSQYPASAQEAVPIGRPCDGEELLVLDAQLKPTPAGEIGDLYIRGEGLSPGYWRDAEKTRGVFLPYPGSSASDPSDRIYKTGDLARLGQDGLLYFIGRADTQIKSRGYRIELGEIETALHSLPGLRESAIVAIPSDGFEGWKICCAYVPAKGETVTVEALRKGLAGLVPSYMLPGLWSRFESLPKNANGKIDRPMLKSTFIQNSAPARPVAPALDAQPKADGLAARASSPVISGLEEKA